MKKQNGVLLGITLIFVVFVTAALGLGEWLDLNKNGQLDIYENPELAIGKRVDDLISKMTIEDGKGRLKLMVRIRI